MTSHQGAHVCRNGYAGQRRPVRQTVCRLPPAIACRLLKNALEDVQSHRVERGGVAVEEAAGVGLRTSQVVDRYFLLICLEETVELLEVAAWFEAPVGCEMPGSRRMWFRGRCPPGRLQRA
jgi:hypothetical protein